DGSLVKLAEELRRSDRILAPAVLLPDGSRQDSAQAEPGSAGALAIAAVPPALMPPPLRSRACPWTSSKPQRVGWAVGCCLAARVIHRGAHSTEPAFGGEAFELLAAQRRRVIAERRGRDRARRDDLLQAITFVNRIVLKTLTGRSPKREREQLRALRASR